MTIWRAELFDDEERYLAVPGQVAAIDAQSGGVVVICGSGKLRLTEIGYQGARCAPASVIKSIRKRLT
jgi:methionyl-tRNA formyltransferase